MKGSLLSGICGAFAIMSAAVCSPSLAKVYQFKAQGVLGDPYSVDKDMNVVPAPTSQIGTGDTLSISFRFDTDDAVVQSLFDADPAINIYYGNVSQYRLSVGSYQSAGPRSQQHFASFQLWDGYNVGSVGPVDSFSLMTFKPLSGSNSPVDLGSGQVNEILNLYNFDPTASVRSSDLISEITPLDGYAWKSGHLGFINPVSFSQTQFSIGDMTTTLSAVPEPATWALMIFGFGGMGLAMRRRDRTRLVASGCAF